MAFWGTTKKEDQVGGAPAASISPEPTSGMQSRAPESPVTAPPAPNVRFGIDHTIQLMRSLPTNKDADLVVTVMKATLESVNVRVPDIIQDAEKRLSDMVSRVSSLKAEIAGYEREMDVRLQEIVRIETAHAEVLRVKEFLELSADIAVPVED